MNEIILWIIWFFISVFILDVFYYRWLPAIIRNPVLEIHTNIKTLEYVKIPSWVRDLRIIGKGLESLKGCPEGIQKLDLQNNKLKNLEYLPLSATHVRASSNQITTLLHLVNHKNIVSLGLSFNHLTNLIGFPPHCKNAVIYYNMIISPKGLPQDSKMDKLFLGNNLITSDTLHYIPVTTNLDLICNKLTNLEGLKEGIEILHTDSNRIVTLKGIPSTLTILRVSDNLLTNCIGTSELRHLKVINLLKMDQCTTLGLPKTVEEIIQ